MIMVCEPYVVNFLNHMPIFEMYMARLMNRHHKEMCCDEIESCILSLLALINSRHKMGGKMYNLYSGFLYFCISIMIAKLESTIFMMPIAK